MSALRKRAHRGRHAPDDVEVPCVGEARDRDEALEREDLHQHLVRGRGSSEATRSGGRRSGRRGPPSRPRRGAGRQGARRRASPQSRRGSRSSTSRGRQEVGEDEAVARHDLADRAPATGRRNIGPAQAKVWNSPFSPQGSTLGGQVAPAARVEARPAKAAASARGSTQVSRACSPPRDHLLRRARPSAGPRAGRAGSRPVPAMLRLAVRAGRPRGTGRRRRRRVTPSRARAASAPAIARLVRLVRARRRDAHHRERQPQPRRPAPRAAPAHARASPRDRRPSLMVVSRPTTSTSSCCAQGVQRPGAVLPAAPGEEHRVPGPRRYAARCASGARAGPTPSAG